MERKGEGKESVRYTPLTIHLRGGGEREGEESPSPPFLFLTLFYFLNTAGYCHEGKKKGRREGEEWGRERLFFSEINYLFRWKKEEER